VTVERKLGYKIDLKEKPLFEKPLVEAEEEIEYAEESGDDASEAAGRKGGPSLLEGLFAACIKQGEAAPSLVGLIGRLQRLCNISRSALLMKAVECAIGNGKEQLAMQLLGHAQSEGAILPTSSLVQLMRSIGPGNAAEADLAVGADAFAALMQLLQDAIQEKEAPPSAEAALAPS